MNDHAQTRREGRLRLGFLTNVPFTSDAGGPGGALGRGAQPERRFLPDRLAETAPSTPD
jgi:hypothetical protein